MNAPRIAVALCVLSFLLGPASAHGRQDGYEQGSPARTKEKGDRGGSFFSIDPNASSEPESSAISLDAIAGSPSKYEGKTLARRVTLTTDPKEEAGAFTIGVADAETGRRVAPGLQDGGIGFFVTSAMANKMNKKAERGATAVVTFTIARLPDPGRACWAAIISRIQVLKADGGVAATIQRR